MKSRSFRKRNRKLQQLQQEQEQEQQQQQEEVEQEINDTTGTTNRTRPDDDDNNNNNNNDDPCDSSSKSNTSIDKTRKRQQQQQQQQQKQQKKLLSNLNATNDLSFINTKIVRLTIPTNNTTNNYNSNNTLLLRIIEPYTYTFISNVKGRWINRTVLDVYTTEFGSYPISYYTMAIQQGRIQVSSQIVALEYKLKENDILYHTVHRHEPAVAINTFYNNTDNSLSSIISIVGETNNIVAVDKPSTMPVHPCGGYHKNTLMSILESIPSNNVQPSVPNQKQKQRRFTKLYTIHRLDRLTSGLVILAKSSEVAKQWSFAIQQKSQNTNSTTANSCEKLYVAKVKGKFLASLLVSSSTNNKNNHDTTNTPQQPPPRLGLVSVEEGRCNKVPINGEWSIDKRSINNDKNSNSDVSSVVNVNTDNQTNSCLLSTSNNNTNNYNNKRKRQHKSIHQKQLHSDNTNVSLATKAQHNRSTNAFGYWITNQFNQKQNDVSLEDFCSIEHSIDEWFDVLQSNCSNTSTNTPNTNTTTSESDNQESMQTINQSDIELEQQHQQQVVEKNSIKNNKQNNFYWFNFACPVRIEEHKNGVCSAGTFTSLTDELYISTVKGAQTSFAILHYDTNTDTTIVLCKPITGRTHQIRIHLQYLGNPIANDPNYGGTLWYNNPSGQYACTYAQQMLSLLSSSSSTTTTTTCRDNADNNNNNENPVNDSTTSSSTVFATRRDVPVNVYQNNNNDSTTDNCNFSVTTNDSVRNISDEPATENEIRNSTMLSEPQRYDETWDDFIKRTCVWCARIKSTSTSNSTCPIVMTTANAIAGSSTNGETTTETTTETITNNTEQQQQQQQQQQQLTSTTIYRSSTTVDKNVNSDNNDITRTNVQDTNTTTTTNIEPIIDRDSLEFLVRSPGLWLHALRYTVNGISFQTSIPDWSKVSK